MAGLRRPITAHSKNCDYCYYLPNDLLLCACTTARPICFEPCKKDSEIGKASRSRSLYPRFHLEICMFDLLVRRNAYRYRAGKRLK